MFSAKFSMLILTYFIFSPGILNKDGSINNPESIKRLAEVSLAYAKAGKKILQTLNYCLWSLNIFIPCHFLKLFIFCKSFMHFSLLPIQSLIIFII